jgi:hypothetical protein
VQEGGQRRWRQQGAGADPGRTAEQGGGERAPVAAGQESRAASRPAASGAEGRSSRNPANRAAVKKPFCPIMALAMAGGSASPIQAARAPAMRARSAAKPAAVASTQARNATV